MATHGLIERIPVDFAFSALKERPKAAGGAPEAGEATAQIQGAEGSDRAGLTASPRS
ncbi:MAG TPA: hypothetical protein VND96_15875 [Candidatus Micrarchaeaceae archaeon]|nr:hypothetical protein [Candidatus Micrarchaeaceae archaeon]